MRIGKSYLHGVTLGTPPSTPPKTPEKRGQCKGWSPSASARNVAFLRSIPEESLTGSGEAFTLTLKNCPDTSDDWATMRDLLVRRLMYAGAIRIHWVTEWQRRGVPHLHGCVWWGVPEPEYRGAVLHHWLQIAEPYGVSSRAQTCIPITNALGWFQYTAKHAARGYKHYQRDSANMPTGWQTSGRIWGYRGDWDIQKPLKLRLDDLTFHRLRRLVRRWRIADARQSGNSFRIRTARTMLRCPLKNLSNVRGVSEWIPRDLYLLMVLACADSAESVSYADDAETCAESLHTPL